MLFDRQNMIITCCLGYERHLNALNLHFIALPCTCDNFFEHYINSSIYKPFFFLKKRLTCCGNFYIERTLLKMQNYWRQQLNSLQNHEWIRSSIHFFFEYKSTINLNVLCDKSAILPCNLYIISVNRFCFLFPINNKLTHWSIKQIAEISIYKMDLYIFGTFC